MYLFDAVVPEQAMADAVIGNESVPIQLGWPFPVQNVNVFFQIKYTETILSNSTRKLL